MIITISGMPGSGKSTVAKILQQKLSAERIYVGGLRRNLAREKGMTLAELNAYAQTHPETDVDIDQKVAAEARALDHGGKIIIVEGRTQFHFLPESLKVFIKVDIDVGAERIWKDLQSSATKQERNEGTIRSSEEMKRRTREREEEDARRYLKYYGIDHREESQYDLVLDSTSQSAEQIAEKIMAAAAASLHSSRANAKKSL
ncbi:AAA family ATPase [Candidatus Woesearchaeota archaeon]|nr:AAA family ATPase [Candidatus Woesearchaeota archaeon]